MWKAVALAAKAKHSKLEQVQENAPKSGKPRIHDQIFHKNTKLMNAIICCTTNCLMSIQILNI